MQLSSTTSQPSKEGFWEKMKKQYNDSKKSQSTIEYPATQNKQNENISQIRDISSSISLSKVAQDVKTGDIIEHERFGRGKVTAIESSGNDKRAFVDFDSSGKKQLLLKFAKFRIIS